MAVRERVGVQIQDMTKAEPWRSYTRGAGLSTSNHREGGGIPAHDFVDPTDGRVVRVLQFRRTEPGEVLGNHPGSRDWSPRHRHNFEKVSVRVTLPLPGSTSDPAEPLEGVVAFQPEGTWYGPMSGLNAPVPATEDAIRVGVYLQTTGAQMEPFLTREQLKAAMEKIRDGQIRGEYDFDKATYTRPDGTETDGYEAAWETAMGRDMTYVDPPRVLTGSGVGRTVDVGFADVAKGAVCMPVTAHPWYPSTKDQGVLIKPFVAFNACGPFIRMVKLERGATLRQGAPEVDRFTAVLQGTFRYGDEVLKERHALYGAAGDAYEPIAAEEPTLLWQVSWQPGTQRVAPFWQD